MGQPAFRIEVPESERANIRCDRQDRDRFNKFREALGYQQHQFLKVLLDLYAAEAEATADR